MKTTTTMKQNVIADEFVTDNGFVVSNFLVILFMVYSNMSNTVGGLAT